MKYLIDTAKIISEGLDSTLYSNKEIVITSHTFSEIESKGLSVDATKFSVIESPAFSDFESYGKSFYTWSDGTNTLQLIKWEQKSYIPALCGKHDTTFQISLVGGSSFCLLCKEILEKDADFSQITAVLLNEDIKPAGTPDDCLSISLNKIFNAKNNSTNLCH